MSRCYKKKTTSNHSHHDLVRAMEMVNNGTESIYNSAKTCGMPKETLQRCLKDNNYENQTQEWNTVLSYEEEDILIHALQCTASCGFPQDSDDIKEMVRKFCEKLDTENLFKDGIPGKEWLIAFKKCHASKLSQCKPELLTESLIRCIIWNYSWQFLWNAEKFNWRWQYCSW